jgi:selenocysteine lyase/cysteine desulfurase
MEVLLQIGIARVQAEALSLARLVVDHAHASGKRVLSTLTPQSAPIVTFQTRRDPTVLMGELRAHGISVAARGGGLRVAPHVHNGPQHIERLFAVLDALDA